jgi:hypothetical protein
MVSARPNPTLTAHLELDSETYVDVTHGSVPTINVGVEPPNPKPEPKKVTKIPPKTGECRGRRDERAGTLKENAAETVATSSTEVIWIVN